MNAEQIQSDTLTILLSNRIHRELDNKARAIKLSKTCKFIRNKTKDKMLYSKCEGVVELIKSCYYLSAINKVNQIEINYYSVYGA